MRTILSIVASLTVAGVAHAQTPPGTPQTWSRSRDSGSVNADVVRSVKGGPGGSVSAAGTAQDALRVHSIVTMRYDAQGNLLWSDKWHNSPDSSGFYSDAAIAVGVDAAGNTYTLGESWGDLRPTGSEWDYVLIKYSPTGERLWLRRYNGPGNWSDSPSAMVLDAAGDCYVSGFAFYQFDALNRYATDFHVIKYTPAGDVAWQYHTNNPAGGNIGAGARSIALDAAGNVYATGVINDGSASTNANNNDILTVKLSSDGQLVYRRTYSSPSSIADTGSDDGQVITADAQGNAYAAGYWRPLPNGGVDRHLDTITLKYSPTGTLLWTQTTSRQGEERAMAIDTDASGNVYVGGVWFSPLENNGWIESYSSSGVFRWAYVVDETGDYDENAVVGLKVGSDGNVYAGCDNQRPGPTGYDPTLIKLAPNGSVLMRLPVDAGSTSDSTFAFDLDAQGNAILGGSKYVPATAGDFLVTKIFGPAAPVCAADINGSATVTVQDIFDFLTAWFSAGPHAGFNHTGSVTVQDIFDFLSAWFTGCP